MTVEFARDLFGDYCKVWDPWLPGDREVIARSGVRRVEIQGWPGRDLPPLDLPPSVEELLVAPINIKSDGSVQHLRHLRSLILGSYARDRIDFTQFPELRRLDFYWRPGGDTAFANPSIEQLGIRYWPYRDLRPLGALARLRELAIGQTRRIHSLEGIEALPQLETLELILAPTPIDLAALAGAPASLRFVGLDGCTKLASLEVLASLPALEVLDLNSTKEIPSIRWLSGHPTLRALFIAGSTNILDGDLSPLFTMPALEEVRVRNRRHYSHTRAEVEAFVARRPRRERRGWPRW